MAKIIIAWQLEQGGKGNLYVESGLINQAGLLGGAWGKGAGSICWPSTETALASEGELRGRDHPLPDALAGSTSEEEAGGRKALRTQNLWRREGKPVLVDRLDFWKRLLSIMLEQEVAVWGPEGRREGQSGRIRPQMASQMGTGGHQMGQMLYLLGSTFLAGQERWGVGFPSPVMYWRNVGMWASGRTPLKHF